eukprot:CAMPEP_0119567746 /NCGR_PEP_ID=MMETSP1352-20130426/36844_1 /TAXON_ID=265584 /ORGANISM="Stauroneis constricta, Strain CCMP1120" /LENGTH=731 /DNA_ID=CAMNT_0007617035 /DNA_START=67 /DNA_END=2262 /DNA_ORIENTATION=+
MTKEEEAKKEEKVWTPELQADFERILTVGEECIAEADLKKLLLAKGRGSGHQGFNLYDGFEPSGRMHIAQGVFKAMNVNKCTAEGTNSTFIFWVADWFALMNDKMGGDLEKIKTVGKYLMEVWKAAGMDLSHVVFKWASEEITNNADKYWPTMLDVARRFNVTRIKKCCQIMGRLEGSLTAAQILYPLMQCTDVFFLKADICQLGVDQRKVNMLARDYCLAAKIKNKPVILSHHMLYGLKAGQEKMSKSDPDSAVFMEDAAEDVERKIMNAYCPSKVEGSEDKSSVAEDAGKESMHLVEDELKNPCLDYIENIIFAPPGATFVAGDTSYDNFATVKEKFLAGDISEEDLKRGLIASLNTMLAPVRDHFTNDDNAKNLLALVQQYKKEALPKDKAVRRLNLVELGKVPAGSHVVFAPLPSSNPTLQDAVATLRLLHQSGDKPCILYLSDWSARVCNSCGADLKGIDACYSIFLNSLKALDSEKMANVKVVKQSESILADPSNFWISVINVGRHFMLDDVMGPSMKDSDGVGIVVARLMKVADVAGLEPASIAMAEGDEATVMDALVSKFFDEKLPGVTKPSISIVQTPELLLQQRESDAHKTDNDEYFLLDDPKAHGKSKMKKAFCEPGNVTFCPPITLASTFFFGYGNEPTGEMVIKRSEENGGDIVFKQRSDIEAGFADESLHPGDLKTAVAAKMVEIIEKLSSSIKADSNLVKQSKALKALHKKLLKKK